MIRDRDNLDDFLYELSSRYMNPKAGSKFDTIDAVFIDGNCRMLPWNTKMQKVGSSYLLVVEVTRS